MSSMRVSVSEAAQLLGVNRQRIHQRIRNGSIEAEKVGNQWSIERAGLFRAANRAGPGRPLSARSAWELLGVAAADQAFAAGLSAPAKSRARSRLKTLLATTRDADLDNMAALLSRSLRNRARRVSYVSAPRDLIDLRGDRRVRLAGISRPESNVAAGEIVEGYVDEVDEPKLVKEYLLGKGSQLAKNNVIFHVLSPGHIAREDVNNMWSLLLVAADMSEHDGVREKNEAAEALDVLRAEFKELWSDH